MGKVVVILAMLEEKWLEADFLRRQIQSQGYETLVVDMGLMGEPRIKADIARDEVVLASGRSPQEAEAIADRGKRMPMVVEGCRQKVKELCSQSRLDGIISIGGTTGTQMGTSIMKSLPFGVPKLAVSSTASLKGFASRSIGSADITLMNSVVEFAGLNSMLKNVLARAAMAVCGMVEGSAKASISLPGEGDKPLIAMTQFGGCENCALRVRLQLEERGFQVVGFSASGTGDRAMEEMIKRENHFGAVIDLAPGGVGEELFHGARSAGPTRLEAAGKKGIPQVIAPSGVNLMSPLKSDYKPEYDSRKRHDYDALRTLIRLSAAEMITVGRAIAGKLNRAKGPVKVLIPLGGWSSLDRRGADLYEPDMDRVFVDELSKRLKTGIEVREVDADLEAPDFADAVVKALLDVLRK